MRGGNTFEGFKFERNRTFIMFKNGTRVVNTNTAVPLVSKFYKKLIIKN
jgi:hypothetical protein